MISWPTTPAERLIAALDVPEVGAAMRLSAALGDRVGFVKVGLELYTAAGPDAVKALRSEGREVFLDLKLHDIPNTVAGAARAAEALGAAMLTVHASGGAAMLRAARESYGGTLLAVTVLTSLDEGALADVGFAGTPLEAAVRLASLAVKSGADGVVCSPREVAALRAALGPGVLLVVPGIRPAGAASGDQARVGTPGDAVRAGADYLVVGRPLRDAADPAAAAEALAREVSGSRL